EVRADASRADVDVRDLERGRGRSRLSERGTGYHGDERENGCGSHIQPHMPVASGTLSRCVPTYVSTVPVVTLRRRSRGIGSGWERKPGIRPLSRSAQRNNVAPRVEPEWARRASWRERMMRSWVAAIALAGLVSSTADAQDAKTVIGNASKAMG